MTRSIHRLAAKDFTEAVDFYRSEVGTGMARRFLNNFERIAKLLEEFPGIGTPAEDGRQIFPLGDFPYSIRSESVV